MLLFRLSLHKNFLFFFVYFLGAFFFFQNQAYASKPSSLYPQHGTIESKPYMQIENKTIFGTASVSQIIVADASTVQESVEQESKAAGQQEGKTLKLWGFHQGNKDKSAPVTVSTSNSTLSVIKKTQQRAKLFPLTNSTTLLPGFNGTVPVSLPPSNMPQIEPFTSW